MNISDRVRESLAQAFRDAGFVDVDDDTLPTWPADPSEPPVWQPVESLVDTVIDAGWLPASAVGDLQASEADLVSAPLRKEIERLKAESPKVGGRDIGNLRHDLENNRNGSPGSIDRIIKNWLLECLIEVED